MLGALPTCLRCRKPLWRGWRQRERPPQAGDCLPWPADGTPGSGGEGGRRLAGDGHTHSQPAAEDTAAVRQATQEHLPPLLPHLSTHQSPPPAHLPPEHTSPPHSPHEVAAKKHIFFSYKDINSTNTFSFPWTHPLPPAPKRAWPIMTSSSLRCCAEERNMSTRWSRREGRDPKNPSS